MVMSRPFGLRIPDPASADLGARMRLCGMGGRLQRSAHQESPGSGRTEFAWWGFGGQNVQQGNNVAYLLSLLCHVTSHNKVSLSAAPTSLRNFLFTSHLVMRSTTCHADDTVNG